MDLSNITGIIFSLLTLTFLEIVLGIDNLVFLSIVTQRLPPAQQSSARKFGLLFALVTRLLLLASIVWVAGLVTPLFYVYSFAVSGRDLILFAGGLFLLYKSTMEVHTEFEGDYSEAKLPRRSGYFSIIFQVGMLDMVFSLDSIITAVGLTQVYWVMATAIIIAIIVMVIASEPLSHFIENHPTIKMLALSFLLLIGTVLVADALHFDIPRGYLYFAISFSLFVESMNILRSKRRSRSSVDPR